MDEAFELPVHYQNKELQFPARFLRTGYSYKIEVEIDEQPVQFEPDEERAWRAVMDPELAASSRIKTDLLQAVVASLDHLFK